MLPEGVNDILPSRAIAIENLRQKLVCELQSWGYQLVIPAIFESLESLEVNGDKDLIDSSFKLTDPISGKIIALRVDMTTQIARIDARSNSDAIQRFFYVDRIFKGKNKHYKNTRTPIQLGAEIYGHSGIESDIETLEMALGLLAQCGYKNLVIDLSHALALPKIISPIIKNSAEKNQIIDLPSLNQAIKQKSMLDIQNLLGDSKDGGKESQDLLDLISLIGNENQLDEIAKRFPAINPEINQIKKLIDVIKNRADANIQINWHIDLSNSGNYDYYNGLIFSILDKNQKVVLAKGGRYDSIGKPFGASPTHNTNPHPSIRVARAATGFSMFIDHLNDTNHNKLERKIFINAGALSHPELKALIAQIKADDRFNQPDQNNYDLKFIRALSEESVEDQAENHNCQEEIKIVNNQLKLTTL